MLQQFPWAVRIPNRPSSGQFACHAPSPNRRLTRNRPRPVQANGLHALNLVSVRRQFDCVRLHSMAILEIERPIPVHVDSENPAPMVRYIRMAAAALPLAVLLGTPAAAADQQQVKRAVERG